MKPPIKFLAVISIIFCNSFCDAQIINTPAQWLAYQQHELKGCSYIFEGTVMRQECSGSTTCNVIKITKIYRGNSELKLGSIKIITMFGTKCQLKQEDMPPGLHTGYTYVIFGNISNSTAFQSIAVDNSLTFWCNDWVTFIGGGAEWGWRKVSKYSTVDSLYSFFNENGLTVEAEQK